MKKAAITLGLMLSLIGTAQNQSTVTILTLNPDTVYAGDSITVNFKFSPPSGIGMINQDQWYISSQAQGQIMGISYPTYYSLPKTVNGPADTTYHLKLKTMATHNIGWGTVKTHNSNVVPFVFCCNTTGIEEYQGADIIPAYYDLMGNRISPRSGEIIIEQRGVHRRKIFVQN